MSGSESGSEIRRCFDQCQRRSIKFDTYFPVYERLFSPLRGREVTFVEVGVLGGGSLEMWRRYFGEQARIIGIDFNAQARSLEQDGFEIFIGSQSDQRFWRGFFATVGQVDVILDDGGHTTLQQVTTLAESLPHVKDGGLVVVEDVHSSYLPQFGNPSSGSFASMISRWSEAIHHRYLAEPDPGSFAQAVHSVEVFSSVVAFHVDRRLCRRPTKLSSGLDSGGALDLRNLSSTGRRLLSRWSNLVHLLPAAVQDQAKRLAVRCMEELGGERGKARRRMRDCLRGVPATGDGGSVTTVKPHLASESISNSP